MNGRAGGDLGGTKMVPLKSPDFSLSKTVLCRPLGGRDGMDAPKRFWINLNKMRTIISLNGLPNWVAALQYAFLLNFRPIFAFLFVL